MILKSLVGNLASCNAMTLWFGPNDVGHANHIYFSIILATESHLFSSLEKLVEEPRFFTASNSDLEEVK